MPKPLRFLGCTGPAHAAPWGPKVLERGETAAQSAKSRPSRYLPAPVMLALALLWHPAAADPSPPPDTVDLQQIEEGDPITLQDELTNDPGELSLQYSDLYVRTRVADAKETQEEGPSFKLGVIKNVQVSINPNYQTGRGSQRDSGDVVSDILVHTSDQSHLVPATGIDIFYSTPFGAGPKSGEYIFRGIASYVLGISNNAPRLHFNLTDFHLSQPEGARKDQLQLVFGGTFLPTAKGALVGDIIYGASEESHGTETILELGYTRQLPDGWVAEAGIGKQVTGYANAFRVFFSIEKDVTIF